MRVAYACYFDAVPKFEHQVWLWSQSLMRLAEVDPRDLFIFAPERQDSPLLPSLESLGVNTRRKEPFDARHPYCNKIGLWDASVFEDYDQVIFNDCDLFYLQRYEPKHAFEARVVDRPNPVLPLLERIFDAAGVGHPSTTEVGWPSRLGEATFAANFNGGFYSVSTALIPRIAKRWAHWALWSLERMELYRRFENHVDQIAMALAISELGVEHHALAPGWNVPTHLGAHVEAAKVPPPKALHFHTHLDNHGLLRHCGHAQVDEAIDQANTLMRQWYREQLDNRIFWTHRYLNDPKLGSGRGSRGAPLELKRRIMGAVANLAPSVVDFGCGDLEVARAIEFADYVGVDVSPQALAIARAKRPDWRFETPDGVAGMQPAAAAMCFDVLIHQPSRESYLELLDQVLHGCRDFAVLSAYNEPLEADGIVFFHEPIRTSLARRSDVVGWCQVGAYRGVSVLAVAKRGGKCDLPGGIQALRYCMRHSEVVAKRLQRFLDPLARLAQRLPTPPTAGIA